MDDAEDLVALFLSNLFLEVASEVRRVFSRKQLLPQNKFAQRWWQHLLTDMHVSTSALPREEIITSRSWLYEKVVLASRKVGLVGIPALWFHYEHVHLLRL